MRAGNQIIREPTRQDYSLPVTQGAFSPRRANEETLSDTNLMQSIVEQEEAERAAEV